MVLNKTIKPFRQFVYINMIRVVIADDHHLVRQGLRLLLDREHDINVVAEVSDGHEVIEIVRCIGPDVVVMDVEMPEINGIEATNRIREKYPDTQIVMLSMYSDPFLIRKAFDSGAKGYVLKQSISTELVNAIHSVCSGVAYHSRAAEMAETDYSLYSHGTPPQLTSREHEILKMIAAGHTNSQIGSTLSIHIKTVENHRVNLMAKLNTHNLPDLIRTSIKLGLIKLVD